MRFVRRLGCFASYGRIPDMARTKKTPAEELLERWGKARQAGGEMSADLLGIEVGVGMLSAAHQALARHLYVEGRDLNKAVWSRRVRDALKRDLCAVAWRYVDAETQGVWLMAADMAFSAKPWRAMLGFWADHPGAFVAVHSERSLRQFLRTA